MKSSLGQRINLESGWRSFVATTGERRGSVAQAGDHRFEQILAEQARISPSTFRAFRCDPAVIASLRRYLASRGDATSLLRLGDARIIDEFCRRIGSGELQLGISYRRPIQLTQTDSDSKNGKGGAAKAPKPAKQSALATGDSAAAPDSTQPTATRAVPLVDEAAPKQCSNSGCKSGFEDAAKDGTPLVEADAEGCGGGEAKKAG